MTGLEAVTAVAKYIVSQRANIEETDMLVCKYDKEKKANGEYIVVNNLPFTHTEKLSTATINVNIHVPMLPKSETADTKRLSVLTNKISALFDSEYGTLLNGAYFKFATDSRPIKENDGTWFVNIEIECVYNNKFTN
jgi:hypothetical protein